MAPKQNAPHVQNAQPGTYAWCSCGESASQPFCDGSHGKTGTAKRPMRVTIDASKTVAWCGCKKTGTPPFCDGTHSRA